MMDVRDRQNSEYERAFRVIRKVSSILIFLCHESSPFSIAITTTNKTMFSYCRNEIN